MPFSPQYTPPTLGQMRAIVGRTLRDPSGGVFAVDAMNDFISEGLMSLSGYRPIEASEVSAYDPVQPWVVPTILSYVWNVSAANFADPDLNQDVALPYSNRNNPIPNGWDYYDGKVYLGRWLVNNLNVWNDQLGDEVPLYLALNGYRDRYLTGADAEYLDLQDVTDQLCLTRECRALGFQALSNDRALYQQWLAATNNTDVSPTQLTGMLNGAISDVEKQRKRNAILRRTPATGF